MKSKARQSHTVSELCPLSVEQELAEERIVAEVAEASAALLHELNNLINGLLLETRALERDVPPAWKERVGEVRQLGSRIALSIRRFDHYRYARRPPPYAVDLQAVICEILSQQPPNEVVIHWQPAAVLDPVRGTVSDWKRLVRLMLAHVMAETGSAQRHYCIETEQNDDTVRLRIRSGPLSPLPDKRLVFAEGVSTQADTPETWELAASRALAHRLRGHLRYTSSQTGDCAVTVEVDVRTR